MRHVRIAALLLAVAGVGAVPVLGLQMEPEQILISAPRLVPGVDSRGLCQGEGRQIGPELEPVGLAAPTPGIGPGLEPLGRE